MRFRLRVVPTAERHIREASRWWDENRQGASELLRQEVAKAFDLLTTHPSIAPRARDVNDPNIRSFYISRVRYHLYYRVQDDLVEILAFWHTSRGSGPDI